MPTWETFDPGLQISLATTLEAQSGTDRMAFEYLIGQQLLHKQLDRVAQVIERHLPAMPYQELPEHYAEAVVIYTARTGQRVELGGLVPSQFTIGRARRGHEVFMDRGGDIDAADAVLVREMPETYTRYFLTGGLGGPGS